ncbi:GNAT family protein [Luteibacter sp. SG786]|uniref:GNAT family N-acetyltransferase n=1 Tax=Luteibacter sp. SG786 TaxID=2587130 RepID=UPI001FFE26F6|nr:GNAT family protein [Luteibacter sp. SG786]
MGLKGDSRLVRKSDSAEDIGMDTPVFATIATPRLQLDTLVPADAPTLFAYRGDDTVARFQGWKPADLAEAASFIERQSAQVFAAPDSWFQLAIREAETQELVGDLGIHFPASQLDAIEFGVTLRPDRQGRGYAREAMAAMLGLAFGTWGYRRVVGSVDPRNVASIALLRSLGFRQEAHHVESYLMRGEWTDDMVFALLAREWNAGGRERPDALRNPAA